MDFFFNKWYSHSTNVHVLTLDADMLEPMYLQDAWQVLLAASREAVSQLGMTKFKVFVEAALSEPLQQHFSRNYIHDLLFAIWLIFEMHIVD